MLMTALMIVPAALSSAAVILYNALSKQSRAQTPTLLPVSGSSSPHRASDPIQLVKAADAQPAAIHPQAATVRAHASTAQVVTTTLPQPGAIPAGNVGTMVPSAKADNRTGSHAVSGSTNGPTNGKTTRVTQPPPKTVSHTSDTDQIAATTRAASLAPMQQQQQQQAAAAAQAAKDREQRQQHQEALDAAAAQAAKQRQEQQAQQAQQAQEEQQEKQAALQAAAAAKAAQQREAQQAAAAALSAQQQRQQQQEAAQAQASAQKLQQERAFYDGLARLTAAEKLQQEQAFYDGLSRLIAAEKLQQERAFYDGLARLIAAQKLQQERAFYEGLAASEAATQPSHSTSVHPASTVTSTGGVPLPWQYLHNGTVDQGVDYVAPGGTPLYAMGTGTIIAAGISGFGSNTPVLQITEGPLAGRIVFYGHAGPNLVSVGAHVVEGQQISTVGSGIVGVSNGPHLTIGFYPPGPMGSGQTMLQYINSLVGYNTGLTAQVPTASTPQAQGQPVSTPAASSSSLSTSHTSGAMNTPHDFAVALLNAIGAPLTSQNLEAVVSWETAEGGGFGNRAQFNPLNTTLAMPGSHPITIIGVQAYTSWSQGLTATVNTLRGGAYRGIVAALKAGNSAQAVERAVAASPWGTGSFLLLS
jgi:murein DD-endopeptidase MepM/ murein hydrolase activator NlpD